MLVQIMTLSTDYFSLTKLNINNFVKYNYTKISAAMMASKILFVSTVFAVIPVAGTAERQTYETAVKLDTNSANILVGNDRKVSVSTSQSNFDIAKTGTSRQVAYHQVESPSGVENYIGLYKDAAARYGIPWNVLAAVHYVESGASGSTDRSSYAGAQGPMQFMPGTWRAYGVDANGDGTTDVHDVSDAIYGAANLLAAGGAAEGNVDGALFNYNHAQWYVDKVNEVASSIQ